MKKLITEDEEKKIKQLHSLDENMLTDLIDKVKSSDTVQNIKKKFEDLFGIKLGDDEKDTEEEDEDEEDSDIKVNEPSYSDKEVYEKILKGIDAPVTKSNLKFFYAWRQAEGAVAAHNPFNTTQNMAGTTKYNSVGVRNYESQEDGINATIKTLKNGYYPCILDGLRKSIGAKKIAKKCKSNLETWGTGEGVYTVLDHKNLNPPSISTSTSKNVA